MAFKITALVLVRLLIASHGLGDDNPCLEAVKASLEDPLGKLASWNFANKSIGVICQFVGVSCWNDRENKILALELQDMKLKGNFPRAIKKCRSLVKLNLAGNNLSGTIPSDIRSLLPFVTSLDLSNNNFSGEIPVSLANCTYLNELLLTDNRLSGNLPKELALLGRIRKFSVANNLLSGPIPDLLGVFDAYGYEGNRKLCGRPLKHCRHHRHGMKSGEDYSFKNGFATGYLFTFAAVFVSFSVSWLQLKQIIRIMVFSLMGKLNTRKEADHLVPFPTLKHEKEISQLEKMVNRMSYSELCKATDNFSMDNVIGTGKTGTMYKATLPNGWFLAVKRIDDSPHSESQFVSELLALARMRHDNLIPLLGFCIVDNERLLVYKHMSNGNLYDCLHPIEGETRILQWPLRVKIAMGIARGLAWLHHKCIFRVVHRTISSRCVLLDRYFEPKISNFGCSIVSNYGGAMFVYPNENDSGLFVNSGVWESDFVKKDVYDYGTLLLELITGKETITSSCSSLHNTLVEWINHLSSCSSIFNDAIDKPLIGQGFDGEILEVLRIVSDCVHPLPYERPTMLQVYNRISKIGGRYGIPCDYGLLLLPRRS